MKEIYVFDFKDICNLNVYVLIVCVLLFEQLKKYYEFAEDVNFLVKLELCIIVQGDQIYLLEFLVSDIVLIYMYIQLL